MAGIWLVMLSLERQEHFETLLASTLTSSANLGWRSLHTFSIAMIYSPLGGYKGTMVKCGPQTSRFPGFGEWCA